MGLNLGVFNLTGVSDPIINGNQKTHIFTLNVIDYISLTVVRIEYSVDKIDWHNVSESDYEITANGVYNLIIDQDFPVDSLRFNYISGNTTVEVYYHSN